MAFKIATARNPGEPTWILGPPIAGEPPEALVASDHDVRTILGDPWPGSREDRRHGLREQRKRDRGEWPSRDLSIASNLIERKIAAGGVAAGQAPAGFELAPTVSASR